MKNPFLIVLASIGLLALSARVVLGQQPGTPIGETLALPECLTHPTARDWKRSTDCIHGHVGERGAAAIVELLDARERLAPDVQAVLFHEAKRHDDPAIRSRLQAIAQGQDYLSLVASSVLASIAPASAWRIALARLEARSGEPERADRESRDPPLDPLLYFQGLDWTTAPPDAVSRALPVLESRFPSELAPHFSCGNSVGNVREYGPVFATLVAIGKPAVPLLHRLARAEDPLVRRNALFTLIAIPDPANAALFEAALDDPDERVRRLAIWLTFATTGCASVERFERLVDDPAASVGKRALRAVADCGRPSAIPALLKLLPEPRAGSFRAPPPSPGDELEPYDGSSLDGLLRELVFGSEASTVDPDAPADAVPRDRESWMAWWAARGEQFDPVAALRRRFEACAAGEDAACDAIGIEGLRLASRVGDASWLALMREADEELRRAHLEPWFARHALEARLGVADLRGEALDVKAAVRDRAAALALTCRSDKDACGDIVAELFERGSDIERGLARVEAGFLRPERRRVLGLHLAHATNPATIRSGYELLMPALRSDDCEVLRVLVADDEPPSLRQLGETLLATCPVAPRGSDP